MRRLILIGALLIVALVCVGGFLGPLLATIPASITDASHGATIAFSTSDTTVLVDSVCVELRWRVDNVSALEVDGDGVVGEGSRESCGAPPTLNVTFRDGVSQSYALPKDARLNNLFARLLLAVAVFAAGLALVVSGLPSRLWARWSQSRIARRLDDGLPRWMPDAPTAASRRAILFAAVALVLVGAAVRTFYLTKSLRYDESSTYVHFASKSFSFIVTAYDAPNNHIFHTLLASLSTRVFGTTLWSLRLPAYFAGILIVAATFAVGRRFYGSRAGLLAAALAAGASWLIEYSVYARGYTLIALDFLLLLLVATSLRRRPTVRRWLLFALLSALGLYTIPVMVYPLGIVYAWLGLSILQQSDARQRARCLKQMALALIAAVGLALICYLPAMLHVLQQGLDSRFGITESVGWSDFLASYQKEMVQVWLSVQRDLAPWLVALLVLGFVVALVAHSRMSRYRVSLLPAALLWLPAVFFIQMAATYDRLWVYLFPLCLVLASAGLVYLARLLAHSQPALRLMIPLALVTALVSSVGETRSPSIQLAGGPGSVAGTEEIFVHLAALTDSNDVVVCGNYCMSMDVYGIIYDVNVAEASKNLKLPKVPFYLVMTTADPVDDLDSVWESLGVTPSRFKKISLALQTGDTAVYRLVPRSASS